MSKSRCSTRFLELFQFAKIHNDSTAQNAARSSARLSLAHRRDAIWLPCCLTVSDSESDRRGKNPDLPVVMMGCRPAEQLPGKDVNELQLAQC
jgi:hypothetical protein